MGEPIPELGREWYNTHPYSLESFFHSHVLKQRCRVHHWEEANISYVPFNGGLDILGWHFKNLSNVVEDTHSKELVEWFEQQKHWRRHFGVDHLFVLGKISWDLRRPANSHGRTAS